MAIPAFFIVSAFPWFLPVSLGFAAGAMIWMSLYELVPDAIKKGGPELMALSVTVSIAAMMSLEILLS
jgi:zinc transporter ZupT